MYHNIVVTLTPFVMYTWYAMTPTKCAKRKNDKFLSPVFATFDEKNVENQHKNENEIKLTCRLATHKVVHSYSLCCCDAQTSRPPTENKEIY